MHASYNFNWKQAKDWLFYKFAPISQRKGKVNRISRVINLSEKIFGISRQKQNQQCKYADAHRSVVSAKKKKKKKKTKKKKLYSSIDRLVSRAGAGSFRSSPETLQRQWPRAIYLSN